MRVRPARQQRGAARAVIWMKDCDSSVRSRTDQLHMVGTPRDTARRSDRESDPRGHARPDHACRPRPGRRAAAAGPSPLASWRRPREQGRDLATWAAGQHERSLANSRDKRARREQPLSVHVDVSDRRSFAGPSSHQSRPSGPRRPSSAAASGAAESLEMKCAAAPFLWKDVRDRFGS
jgi:hypothetical protein